MTYLGWYQILIWFGLLTGTCHNLPRILWCELYFSLVKRCPVIKVLIPRNWLGDCRREHTGRQYRLMIGSLAMINTFYNIIIISQDLFGNGKAYVSTLKSKTHPGHLPPPHPPIKNERYWRVYRTNMLPSWCVLSCPHIFACFLKCQQVNGI